MATQYIIRDYVPSDFPAIRRIHEETQIDYCMPDLNSPLFLVTKVVTVGEEVRAAGGLFLQVETYLWMDKSDWALPEEKLQAIQAMSSQGFEEAWLRGIDCAVLWLPPGMERFGERLEKDLGFTKDRDGWISYSRKLIPTEK